MAAKARPSGELPALISSGSRLLTFARREGLTTGHVETLQTLRSPKPLYQMVAQGEDDVKRFRFFDADTKCIFQVRGGPSNVDNDLIGKCAKTAYALIGPDQIKPGAPAATAPAAGSGSAD